MNPTICHRAHFSSASPSRTSFFKGGFEHVGVLTGDYYSSLLLAIARIIKFYLDFVPYTVTLMINR